MLGTFAAKLVEPVPWVFLQKSHGRVERGAAPHFQAEKLRGEMSDGVGDGEQIVSPHARRQQRLMRIAERRVGEEQRFLLANPSRESFRAKLAEAFAAFPAGGAAPCGYSGIGGSTNSRRWIDFALHVRRGR